MLLYMYMYMVLSKQIQDSNLIQFFPVTGIGCILTIDLNKVPDT